mmetsp:Transcript_6247/g.18319  ORF Transcript_6247/g.18319 Transcript_6247/m.18319 type:complete len:99 (-) Transcript_6247:3363-3659(-)
MDGELQSALLSADACLALIALVSIGLKGETGEDIFWWVVQALLSHDKMTNFGQGRSEAFLWRCTPERDFYGWRMFLLMADVLQALSVCFHVAIYLSCD